MRPSEAVERHREQMPVVIARLGASNPQLFGFVARSDTDGSDVDMMVDLSEGVSYCQVFKIEDALSDLLGCRVDIPTSGRPNSRFARRIKEDLKPL